MIRTVALDVGETLVRDDRYWAGWADWLQVPRHTMSALVGAVVTQGRDNTDALRTLRPGIDLAAETAAREAAGRGEHLTEQDLYEDVRTALAQLREAGLRVVVAGNQTTRAGDLLRGMRLPVDALAVSAEWHCAKPETAFYSRLIDLADTPPEETLYVGDQPSRDVFPARVAGLRTAHLRRGPWGHFWADDPEVRATADWCLDSLHDLTTLPALHP